MADFEYRVGMRDNGDVPDYLDRIFAAVDDAQAKAVSVQRTAIPPYDEVWIERRPAVFWERIALDERRNQAL